MIRSLMLADAERVAALHAAAFEAAWSVSDMQDHITRDIALGWDQGVGLAGFILIRAVEDQSEILTIAVDDTRRQKGIGANLVQAGEKAAGKSGANILFLEVSEDNPAAIRLYKKCGYESYGRRPAYYKREGGRVAAHLFRKKLSACA